MKYVLDAGAAMPMKLFRMATSTVSRGSKRRLSPSSQTQNGFKRASLSLSPERQRSSLSRVPATPFVAPHNRGNKSIAAGAPRKAYIALGSNMGDRVAEIEHACNELTKRGIKVKRTSSLWETEPMYVLDQDSFVNGACEVS